MVILRGQKKMVRLARQKKYIPTVVILGGTVGAPQVTTVYYYLILALHEAIHNVMLGTVELNDVEFKKLKKKKKLLEQVWDADAPLKKKKRLLKQKGAGLLGTLLPPALALLSTLLYKRNA